MSWFRPKPDLSQYPEIPIRRSPPSLSADSGRQSFREMLEAMTAALRATPGVTVDEEVYNPPCSPQTLHAAAEGLKENAHVELCEGFLAFYSEMDGCSVKWSAPAEGQAVRGAIIITPMATALANFREAPEYGCYQHMDELYEVALIPDAAKMAAFRAADPATAAQHPLVPLKAVYNHNYQERALDLDFLQYLLLAIKCKGFWYWPSAIAADLDGDECTIEPRGFRQGMLKLFKADLIDEETGENQFLRRHEPFEEDEKVLGKRQRLAAELYAALRDSGAPFRFEDDPSSPVLSLKLPLDKAQLQKCCDALHAKTEFFGSEKAYLDRLVAEDNEGCVKQISSVMIRFERLDS